LSRFKRGHAYSFFLFIRLMTFWVKGHTLTADSSKR
jgi:hypothetical protein